MTAVYLCLPLLAWQPANPAVPMPTTAPPQMGIVHAVGADGTLELLRTVQKPVTMTEQRPVKVFQNGQETTRTETYTVVKYVSECYVMKFDAAKGRAQQANGHAIASADISKHVAKGDTVMLAVGDAVDPAWLKPLRAETIILFQVTEAPANRPPVPKAMPPAPPAPAPAPVLQSPPAKAGSDLSAAEQSLLDLTNAERKNAGVPPLTAAPLLFRAARQHAANMAKQGNLNHTLDGKGVGDRLNDLGYNWSHCAENIAKGQRTPEEAISSWMQSPGHRENLLSTENTQIGLAVATGADGQQYWAMVLGRPR